MQESKGALKYRDTILSVLQVATQEQELRLRPALEAPDFRIQPDGICGLVGGDEPAGCDAAVAD